MNDEDEEIEKLIPNLSRIGEKGNEFDEYRFVQKCQIVKNVKIDGSIIETQSVNGLIFIDDMNDDYIVIPRDIVKTKFQLLF